MSISVMPLCKVGAVSIGGQSADGQQARLAIIAGPCMLESIELGMAIGTRVKALCDSFGLAYIFKASFDKANRSSISSPRGPGLERGVEWIARIGESLGVPTTTDIHDPSQADAVAAKVDLLQIPAFLCRQTDLLLAAGKAAAKHGRGVNVKKGQFMSPGEMKGCLKKLAEAGCTNSMLTERGTFFGYGRLVNDFLGLGDMMDLGVPVCFDCTHSTQQPGLGGVAGEVTGGRPDRAPLLSRAAAAAGVDALFIECHPEPKTAMSDAATMLRLDEMEGVLKTAAGLRAVIASGR